MLQLCTATNFKYLKNAIVLANSFINHNYGNEVFIYYFDISESIIELYKNTYPYITFLEIPYLFPHSYEPLAFWYKTFAIQDCLPKTRNLLYSDATNLFLRYTDILNLFQNDMFLLIYNNTALLNKYWTTNICFEKLFLDETTKNSYQYWAGFQGYVNNDFNKQFVNEMYNYMNDPEIACPPTDVLRPDGHDNDCLYHRCDQSILSLLIDKHNKHQPYSISKQMMFGDHQTFKLFDQTYHNDDNKMCLSPRHTKHINI